MSVQQLLIRSYEMCHPSLRLLILTNFFGTMMASDFLAYIETSCIFPYLILSTLSGYVRISAVPITHLRDSLFTSPSASPCSQTGGCLTALASIGQSGVVCCRKEDIDLFPLSIISRLNHFTCVTALLLPVLRLELMLPIHSQGLGTGGRLLLIRQACPAVMLSAYKDRSRSQWKTVHRCFRSSHLYLIIS